jgi:hypothetical protein
VRQGGPHIRRPSADQPPPGENLVPGGGGEKSGVVDNDDPRPANVEVRPVTVSFEPSVVSLRPDQQTVLEVVVSGGDGPYRLPLGVAFDPERMVIESVQPAPGVGVVDQMIDDQSGWLGLDLVMSEASDLPRVAAEVTVRAMAPGPVPLVFSTGSATAADGFALPVATSDGALFVLGDDEGGS